jgi:hypothetical protein
MFRGISLGARLRSPFMEAEDDGKAQQRDAHDSRFPIGCSVKRISGFSKSAMTARGRDYRVPQRHVADDPLEARSHVGVALCPRSADESAGFE